MASSIPDWNVVFDRAERQPGATAESLDRLQVELFSPLTAREAEGIAALRRKHDLPPVAVDRWVLPVGPLPVSHVSLLRWSDGGELSRGRRTFSPMVPHRELRSLLLDWFFPEHLPGCLPFAMDGGGVFYAFDMRQPRLDGDYPVLAVHAATLRWNEVTAVATNFVETCLGRNEP